MRELEFKKWMGIFTAVTIFVPYSLVPGGFRYSASSGWDINYALYSMTWACSLPSEEFQFRILFGFEYLPGLFLFGLPLLVYLLQVYRYIRHKTSRNLTLLPAFVALLFPNLMFIIYMIPMFLGGYIGYVGALPIQLLLGYYLMRKFSPLPVAPFTDDAPPEKWWHLRR